jgi:hypothetical protein
MESAVVGAGDSRSLLARCALVDHQCRWRDLRLVAIRDSVVSELRQRRPIVRRRRKQSRAQREAESVAQ